MRNELRWTNCQAVCAFLAILGGAAMFMVTVQSVSMFMACVYGAIAFFLLGLGLIKFVCSGELQDVSDAPAPKAAAPAPVATPAPAAKTPDYDGDGVHEGAGEGKKPETLAAARGGAPDDLKQIKGVGPKLEKLLHSMGFYHFDQVASWGADEVAWVDANLEGFKGRVSRDNWVSQAKTLASGGETEFSKRVEGGDVY